MKIRIEAETPAELDIAESLLRLVFSAGPASEDYRNRRRRHGEQRVPGWRRYVDDNVKPITRLSLYDVVFGNYEPSEVDSTHLRREDADKRADELGGMWHVVAYGIDLASILPAAAGAGADDDDQPPASSTSPAAAGGEPVCRGAICTADPCVYRSAGECWPARAPKVGS